MRFNKTDQAPRGRRGHCALIFGGHMLLHGGYQDLRGSSDELWAFNFGKYLYIYVQLDIFVIPLKYSQNLSRIFLLFHLRLKQFYLGHYDFRKYCRLFILVQIF